MLLSKLQFCSNKKRNLDFTWQKYGKILLWDIFNLVIAIYKGEFYQASLILLTLNFIILCYRGSVYLHSTLLHKTYCTTSWRFCRTLPVREAGPRHWNTGFVSSGASFISWQEGASLALVGHPSTHGDTIKMPYGVDVFHRPASHPISSYSVG